MSEPMNLAAGPELDALVAEYVFNLPVGQPCSEENVHDTPDAMGLVNAYHCSVCDWEVECGDLGFSEFGQSKPHSYTARPYSTEIASAWQVLEKTGLLWSSRLWQDENGWTIGPTDDYPPPWVTAPTAPHAICLAALELVRTKG